MILSAYPSFYNYRMIIIQSANTKNWHKKCLKKRNKFEICTFIKAIL